MRKLLGIVVLSLLFYNMSFALSPDRERLEINTCYNDLKKFLLDEMISDISDDMVKEYCECSVALVSKKYNDIELDEIVSKGKNYMMKKIEFASNQCRKDW